MAELEARLREGETRVRLEFQPGPDAEEALEITGWACFLSQWGKSLKAFEAWSGAIIAVLLQEESSGCVCKTILEKDNKA